MDCFAALAMTWLLLNTTSRSRGADRARGLYDPSPSIKEGAGNAGCLLHPRSRVQNAHKNAHTSIQVQSEHSGIPCAMALRLMPCSPRRRIRLVTVTAGLMADRSGWTNFATDSLAPATGVGTTRFCRTLQAPFVLRAVFAHGQPPCEHLCCARRCRVHHIPPRVRDDRDTPLLPRRDSSEKTTDLGWRGSELFLLERLDDPNQIESVQQIRFCAQRDCPRAGDRSAHRIRPFGLARPS